MIRRALLLAAFVVPLLVSWPAAAAAPASSITLASGGPAESGRGSAVGFERVELTALVDATAVEDFLRRRGAVIELERKHGVS